MKKLKHNRGFTLVEMVISLAITVIIVAAVTMMAGPMLQMTASIKSNANYDTACDTANGYIRSKLETAKSATVIKFTTGSDTDIVSYFSAMSSSANTYALAVYGGKLYDLSTVAKADGSISAKLSADYRVFNDAFYNNNRFTAGFSSKAEDGTTVAKWLKITSQFIEAGGEICNQERTLTFKILGGNMDLSGADVAKGENFVIFYTLPVF